MADVKFSVTFPGGEPFDVVVPAGGQVFALREAAEKEHGVPPACLLKLFQAGQLMHDEMLISALDTQQPVFAVVTRETKVEVLLQAAGTYAGYQELLAAAGAVDEPGAKTKTVAEVPTILKVLEEMSGETKEVEHLKAGEAPGTLEFNGGAGVLLLPSLDVTALLKAAGVETFASATLTVEVNSDAYNRGLGVILEAPAIMDHTVDESGLPSYIYNGYGISSDKAQNAVKFHPNMHMGQIRIEGVGGWGNASMGFTPAGWNRSGKKFHQMRLTVQPDGQNLLVVKGTEDNQIFQRAWPRKLTDGKYLPAIYAWIDLGDSEPLMIGKIGFEIHTQ